MAGAALPALRLASSFKPDLMLVFFGMPTGPMALLVHKLKGIPYILSLRGGDVPGFMGKELARVHGLTMPLTKAVWRNASAIVANSQGLHDLASRTMPDRTIEIVPNGVDTEMFQPVGRAEEPDDKVKLLFVGRLADQKGLSYLIRALGQLEPAIRQKIEVELVGAGPEEPMLRSMVAELGLENVVRFAGWVPRTDIVSHYQAADVFVLPSLDEGLPNVVLEAMASGHAIIATDITGNRELVRDGVNGLLVPPADPDALANAIRRVVESASLRVAMGRKSRELVGPYSWAHTVDRYLELSQRIVNARSAQLLSKPQLTNQ
jgi:glycosyltransferase involved in cell wall biosynthesis